MKSKIIRLIVDEDFNIKTLLGKTEDHMKSISEKNNKKFRPEHHHICEFLGDFSETGKLITIHANSYNIFKPLDVNLELKQIKNYPIGTTGN